MKVTPEFLYEISNKVLADKDLLNTKDELIKQAEKYGDQKDYVLSFLVGMLASNFDNGDIFISTAEALKFSTFIKNINLMKPLMDLITEIQRKKP